MGGRTARGGAGGWGVGPPLGAGGGAARLAGGPQLGEAAQATGAARAALRLVAFAAAPCVACIRPAVPGMELLFPCAGILHSQVWALCSKSGKPVAGNFTGRVHLSGPPPDHVVSRHAPRDPTSPRRAASSMLRKSTCLWPPPPACMPYHRSHAACTSHSQRQRVSLSDDISSRIYLLT